MKIAIPVALACGTACIIASAPSISKPVDAPPARSPLIGQWALDLNSMPIPPDERPASVALEFAEAGQAVWKTTYVITAKDGTQRKMVSEERLDGTAVPIEGDNLEADSVAMTSPAPGVLVMGLSKAGRPGSVRVYTVRQGGASMAESAVNIGDDGKPYVRTYSWLHRASR